MVVVQRDAGPWRYLPAFAGELRYLYHAASVAYDPHSIAEPMPRTKIVCTIGPASRAPDVLRRLIEQGMDVARLNFSHGTRAEHGKVIEAIRRLATQHAHPIAILQDLSGPKVRIGEIAAGTVTIEPGARLTLTARQVPGDSHVVTVTYKGLPAEVQPGDTILLNDGALELEVVDAVGEDVVCQVKVGGPLSSHKGVNLPSRSIKAPSLTDKDREDLVFGIRHGVDYAALSFVRTASDVLEARRFMEQLGDAVPLIAKIEKHEALGNIDEIIEVADGIMVARGDLGVETPLERVPLAQKMLIEKANRAGKPVITATHMLHSMVHNPRPTRAEVTDVANAILDGTDAVMLSEETAMGAYPAEAVAIMDRIAHEVESSPQHRAQAKRHQDAGIRDIPDAVSRAACTLAEDIDAAAIVAFTRSGVTVRMIAKYRPDLHILALTPLEGTCRHLALVWGVVPILCPPMNDTDEIVGQALAAVLNSGLVQKGQQVVIVAGVPPGMPGSTNMVKAEVL